MPTEDKDRKLSGPGVLLKATGKAAAWRIKGCACIALAQQAVACSILKHTSAGMVGVGQGQGQVNTHIAIPLDSGSDLLRAWGDGELRLALESVGQGLLGHSC